MYGTVSEEGKVEVDFIYEPPQQGSEENLLFFRDPEEEKLVEAIAAGLGMRRVGFIFTQTISQDKKDYTLSNREVLQAAEYHAESGLKEWVTAVVKLEVNEDMGADVHFEAFQISDVCVRLFKEGWFETEIKDDDDPKLSKMKKDVVVGVKDTKEVDNDFFLVVVKISDHQVWFLVYVLFMLAPCQCDCDCLLHVTMFAELWWTSVVLLFCSTLRLYFSSAAKSYSPSIPLVFFYNSLLKINYFSHNH